ncbi:winged helix-turn-helix domain-containing protein [Salidesulfovibrio onnuriiensis]|uniref:winged helix-turn-helix domain-containing protein n=1 Tax=Salidesulfovibrio onnuriiensis TaxID=2583823 RepID=UPI00202B232F|nr:LysR family transcriptional regulator [Salidesulfovibrio onnuriiensis]
MSEIARNDMIGPTMRLHLWFETDEGVLFGMGRLMLLRQVELCGSIKAAAEKLGMSYRGAWGKLKKTEEVLGRPLINRGASRRSGCTLTDFGQDLARQFDEWFRDVEEYALRSGKDRLPFQPEKF